MDATIDQSLVIKTGNEIETRGKFLVGTLLLIFILLPILLIVTFWPNTLPPIGEDSEMIYEWRWFNVSLLKMGVAQAAGKNYIHLNSILFILVASAGFLGSMIYVSSSLTNFIGSEKFKRSWTLFYLIKPLTGAGVALLIYFVLRAGLLNYGDANNINLYGVVAFSALAGLFTDKATLKLEEIFSVIFRPKDDRPDKLDKSITNVRITGINPESLIVDGDNNLVISGEGLKQKKLILKINGVEIANPVIDEKSISFSYKIPVDLSKTGNVTLQVLDETGAELFKKDLKIQETTKQGMGGLDSKNTHDSNGMVDEGEDIDELIDVIKG